MKNAIKIFFMLLLPFYMINNGSVVFAADRQIVLGSQIPPNGPPGKFLTLVYTEAFMRLGMAFRYQKLPSQRSSLMSDSGEMDGELSRIYSYNETHQDVIRVEEPHWNSGFLAVAADPSIKLDGWESLRKNDYKVNYVRGIMGCEISLPKVVSPENLEIVDDIPKGFKKLIMGWADIFICSEMDIVRELTSDEFRDSDLHIVGVMEEFTSHAFLHKKHTKLAPKLSNVLKKMKKEGLFNKYRSAAKLIPYLQD